MIRELTPKEKEHLIRAVEGIVLLPSECKSKDKLTNNVNEISYNVLSISNLLRHKDLEATVDDISILEHVLEESTSEEYTDSTYTNFCPHILEVFLRNTTQEELGEVVGWLVKHLTYKINAALEKDKRGLISSDTYLKTLLNHYEENYNKQLVDYLTKAESLYHYQIE